MAIRIPKPAADISIKVAFRIAKAAIVSGLDGMADAIEDGSDGGRKITREEWKKIGNQIADRVREAILANFTDKIEREMKRRRPTAP